MDIVIDTTPTPLPRFSLADLQAFLVMTKKILDSISAVMATIPALAAFAPIVNVLNMIVALFITDPAKQHELMTAISAFV